MIAADALISSGSGRRVDLAQGEELIVSTVDGAQGGDFSFLGFDQALTRNVNGWERFARPWLVYWAEEGMRLYDGDGAPVIEVGECTGDGVNDLMYPGCWSELYEDGRPGCRDLISEALGIERREITGMLSFFVGAMPGSAVYRGLGEVRLRPGDHITLRALRDVRTAVSACPDTEIPGWRPGDLRVETRTSDPS